MRELVERAALSRIWRTLQHTFSRGFPAKGGVILASLAMLLAAAVVDAWSPPEKQISARAYIGVIQAYQAYVSPRMEGWVQCRFVPTCSVYSIQAVRQHGFWRGTWISAKRLASCNHRTPLGTHDPAPSLPET